MRVRTVAREALSLLLRYTEPILRKKIHCCAVYHRTGLKPALTTSRKTVTSSISTGKLFQRNAPEWLNLFFPSVSRYTVPLYTFLDRIKLRSYSPQISLHEGETVSVGIVRSYQVPTPELKAWGDKILQCSVCRKDLPTSRAQNFSRAKSSN